eukprot:CAMPEP_0118988612 /NCGR_PEP_ID=MMETSP1173-20130426/46529_1 /TAXON_ID=1034831 /ORGANISM="Rhizochromulina marina cf, Strain CCMP1243" /LENGTH=72 /DNA_ID=CAMNT_0006939549 /DNA_START=213 /DNA_END=428 /DNA_ORIENTATION=-
MPGVVAEHGRSVLLQDSAKVRNRQGVKLLSQGENLLQLLQSSSAVRGRLRDDTRLGRGGDPGAAAALEATSP